MHDKCKVLLVLLIRGEAVNNFTSRTTVLVCVNLYFCCKLKTLEHQTPACPGVAQSSLLPIPAIPKSKEIPSSCTAVLESVQISHEILSSVRVLSVIPCLVFYWHLKTDLIFKKFFLNQNRGTDMATLIQLLTNKLKSALWKSGFIFLMTHYVSSELYSDGLI